MRSLNPFGITALLYGFWAGLDLAPTIIDYRHSDIMEESLYFLSYTKKKFLKSHSDLILVITDNR